MAVSSIRVRQTDCVQYVMLFQGIGYSESYLAGGIPWENPASRARLAAPRSDSNGHHFKPFPCIFLLYGLNILGQTVGFPRARRCGEYP